MAPKASSISADRLVVDKPATLADGIRKILSGALGNSSLSFKEIPIANGGKAFALRGSGAVGVTETQYALPIKRIATESYWLGATLTFESLAAKFALKGVSIKLFRGSFTQEKLPVLRAEWDSPDPKARAAHAQPHWHAYPDISSLTGTVPSSVEPIAEDFAAMPYETFPMAMPAGKTENIVKFHLAMASSWHLGRNGSHQLNLTDPVAVQGWVQGCVNYIIGQLNYLST